MRRKKSRNSAIPFIIRQIMKTEDYEAFYYRDVKLGPVAPHRHANYELYFFLDGDVEYRVGDFVYSLHSGDFLIIPPDVVHHPKKIGGGIPYRRFVLWLHKDFINKFTSLADGIGYCLRYAETNKVYHYRPGYIEFNDIFGSLLDLWQEYNENNVFKHMMIVNHILSVMLKINRIIYNQTNSSYSIPQKELYAIVLDYINSNITEDLTLETIAKKFYVSKSHISHIFKDNLGISLHKYVIKKRLNLCRSAIAAGEPIAQVAEKFGFADYASFYRAFKKEYGVSPKECKNVMVTEKYADYNDYNDYEDNK